MKKDIHGETRGLCQSSKSAWEKAVKQPILLPQILECMQFFHNTFSMNFLKTSVIETNLKTERYGTNALREKEMKYD